MKSSLVNKLCCPIDKNDLEMEVYLEHENGEILEALLTCAECNRYFPVIYGIPILIPDEYRDRTLEEPLLQKWGYRLEEGEGTRQRLLPEE